MIKHKTKTDRKLITLQEWAVYLGKNRHTIRKKIKEYEGLGFEYDARDIYSVLNFMKFLAMAKLLS